jgi:hypothetical protein
MDCGSRRDFCLRPTAWANHSACQELGPATILKPIRRASLLEALGYNRSVPEEK